MWPTILIVYVLQKVLILCIVIADLTTAGDTVKLILVDSIWNYILKLYLSKQHLL